MINQSVIQTAAIVLPVLGYFDLANTVTTGISTFGNVLTEQEMREKLRVVSGIYHEYGLHTENLLLTSQINLN